tara:strand:+ start:1307 stop:1951 length:645 start_codon:yes stop_codon:yes gene_type:complete
MSTESIDLQIFSSWKEPSSSEALDKVFLARPAEEVAPDLLGARLVSTIDGFRTEGVIVEVEAYLGESDPASHAASRIGRTPRNATMFGPPGFAYVYLIYGIHWCLNVVTGSNGDPCAVLIRAIDPLGGLDVMSNRRGRSKDLGSGPGRVCQAFGITGEFDGHDLSISPLKIIEGWTINPSLIGVSNRIGISKAESWPLRFYILGNESVSRSKLR